jgi:hypothetical protein
MATTINTENNTNNSFTNLKSVIGEVVFSHEEFVESYHIGNHSKIEQNSDTVIIRNDFYYHNDVFSNSSIVSSSNSSPRIIIFKERDDLKVEITKDKVNIYKRKYYCPVSKKLVDGSELFHVRVGYALNKFVVLPKQHRKLKLQPVPYIYCGSLYAVKFIFDIVDARDFYPQGLNILKDFLPQELLDRIAFYLGSDKFKDEYSPTDFPSTTFYSKYKGPVPNKLSQAQLKKLYELGIVNPAYGNERLTVSVSDEACEFYKWEPDEVDEDFFITWDFTCYFNDVYMKRFRNRKEMREWREMCMDRIFDEHPLAGLI